MKTRLVCVLAAAILAPALRAEEKAASREVESVISPCFRVDDSYGGRREVMVGVAGTVLRFLQITPHGNEVDIGLEETRARELLEEVQKGESKPVIPWLFRAVPTKAMPIRSFFLQDRLIMSGIYARFMGAADPRRVSHQQASRFVARLNAACAGTVRFALPSEEELVVAARRLYSPLQEGLESCQRVALRGPEEHLNQLLGHAWHLTRSPCVDFAENSPTPCTLGHYVGKGGSSGSSNPLECMPEYRADLAPDVATPDTSFRLVLVE